MVATPYARPGIDALRGASQAHALSAPRWWDRSRAAAARAYAAARHVPGATRRVLLALSVTARRSRSYALTVGSLACLCIAGFTWNPTLGWVITGVLGLWFNHSLERGGGQ